MSKSPSLRRIQADVRELALDPSDRYCASPLENDMFEWHFTIRGADGTDFEGGVYHGRILLPPEYPFKPPHIMFLTPSGRFECNTKVCLSFSAFHPELWQPAWGIRLILEALISFLPTEADGAVGALDWSSVERKRLALKSQTYSCPVCCCCGAAAAGAAAAGAAGAAAGPSIQSCVDLLPTLSEEKKERCKAGSRFSKEIEQLQKLQIQSEAPKNKNKNQIQNENDETKNTAPPPALETAENDGKKGPLATIPKNTTTTTANTNTNTKLQETIPNMPEMEPLLLNDNGNNNNDNDNEKKNKKNATATRNDDDNNNNPIGMVEDRPRLVPPPDDAMDVADTAVRLAALRARAERVAEMADEIVNEVAHQENPDVSWMYDPLLNIMMLLLGSICYLMFQKFQDLVAELKERLLLADCGEH